MEVKMKASEENDEVLRNLKEKEKLQEWKPA